MVADPRHTFGGNAEKVPGARPPAASAPATDTTTDRYRAEFRALGTDQVREELRRKRWPKDKLAFARQWLDLQDVGAWVATHQGAPKTKSGNRRKWMMYALAAGGALFVIGRLLRMTGHI